MLKSGDVEADGRCMATILPDNPASQLAFFMNHASVWRSEVDAVGLSEELADEVVATTERAAAALAVARIARTAAKSATLVWESAAAEMTNVGRKAISTIKSFALATNPAEVYTAAQLDPPRRPGPKRRDQFDANAAMPRIRSFWIRPDAHGGVEIEWTCGQGATMGAGGGVVYQVFRAIEGGPLTHLEVVGSPGSGRRSVRFTDTTCPAGVRYAQYQVRPIRGGAIGASGPLVTVQFGGMDASNAAVIRRAA